MGGNAPDDFGGVLGSNVRPQRAAVAPRVRPVDGGEVLPLEEHVAALLRRHCRGLVSLSGPPRSGKTTALAHLAFVLPPGAPVAIFDEATAWLDGYEARHVAQSELILIASQQSSGMPCVARFEMAPWGDDDLIEYLLSAHRAQCQAVMFKVKSYATHLSLGGSPDLWRMVLDTMAADGAIPDVAAALRRCLAPMLSDPKLEAAQVCLEALRHNLGDQVKFPQRLGAHALELIRHRPVQLCLASELIVRDLCDGTGSFDLEGHLPHDLVVETARLAAHWPAATQRLAEIAAGECRDAQAMAVSLLLAIRPEWRPGAASVPVLRGAHVAGAHWCGVDLHSAQLDQADLAGADLADADLRGASAAAAVLRGASLRGAKLDHMTAFGGDLAGAQLSGASADGAHFVNVDLHGADLRRAQLRRADLTAADLSQAVLTNARLCEAVLDRTRLTGADLAGADLNGASLTRLDLTDANLAGANFARARVITCAMEGISLPQANFTGAVLKGCYLTGANMPGADFRDADLRNTGLAEVEWEGADLRNADLRGASFHMGSARSGLVGSAVPCEGSKTGFYTDDFDDRDFKTPEEIRKANLCGADLRGARVKGVDFYLVDLRGARFTDKQARHFRRCGAILD